MNSWIHCNVCAAIPSKSQDVVFYLASCAHIICGKCLLKDAIGAKSPQRGINGQCGVCKKPATYRAINRDLPAEMRLLFASPNALMERYSKEIKQVMKFQANHQQHLHRLLQHKQQRVVDHAKEMQARLGKSAEKERHLRADNERLKSELDESMNRGDQLERKLEQTRRELQEAKRLRGVPRSSGGGQSSGRSSQIKHYPSLNGPTPVSTLSFANVVAHSTPINPNDVELFTPDPVHHRASVGGRMTGEENFAFDFNQLESPLTAAPDSFFKTPNQASSSKMSKRSGPTLFPAGFRH